MEIAVPIYDRFTALDAVGPYEVLSRIPGVRVRFVSHEAGPVPTENHMLGLVAEARFEDVGAPDVVVVPGGIGSRALLDDERLLGWLRAVHETTTWTTSVCTGALLLAAAGLLDGLEATTHWRATGELARLGARPVDRRVVTQGKIITAAGVSAGIDMALMLTEQLAGTERAQAVQLTIEYDPEPPFDTGSLGKASDHIRALAEGAIPSPS